MQLRRTSSSWITALVAGMAITASAGLAAAQPEGAPPPMRGPGGPGGPDGAGGPRGPEGGPGMERPGDGAGRGERMSEPVSDRELAERIRARAEEVERLSHVLRDAAAKVEQGNGRLEAFQMIEDASRPLRGDWLERLAGRRARGEGRGDGRMGENRAGEGRQGEERPADGRMGEGRREGRPEGEHQLSDAERESMMQFAREKLPRMAQRIDQLRQTDPQMADRIMLRLAPRVREVLATRDVDLAALRLEELQAGAVVLDQVRILREAMKGEDTPRIDSAKAELKTALEAQFDARIKLQQHDIEMLNKRIESLRADIEKRQGSRDEFVAKLLERMSSADKDGPKGPDGEPMPGPDDAPGMGQGDRGPGGGSPFGGRGGGGRGEGRGEGRPDRPQQPEPPKPE